MSSLNKNLLKDSKTGLKKALPFLILRKNDSINMNNFFLNLLQSTLFQSIS
jgi:ATP-dependent Clp protease adapter protein ClpS